MMDISAAHVPLIWGTMGQLASFLSLLLGRCTNVEYLQSLPEELKRLGTITVPDLSGL